MPDGTKVGGNLGEMGEMARVFDREAGAVANTLKALDHEANNKIPSAWSGPNANKFKEAWTQYRGSLVKVEQALREAKQAIEKNKQAIAAATGSA